MRDIGIPVLPARGAWFSFAGVKCDASLWKLNCTWGATRHFRIRLGAVGVREGVGFFDHGKTGGGWPFLGGPSFDPKE